MSTALTIRERLNDPRQLAEIAKALPKHCSPERMARIAMTAMTRTPKLAECDQASFFRCLLDLSQWGLEPDGRRAHLIPYRNNKAGTTECQLIIDYKGYAELAYRSGVVKNLHADVVRDGDVFEYSLGRVTKHVPWFLRRDEGKPESAGEVFAAYCQAELEGNTVKAEVLSRDEVESIRKRSRAGSSGPWVTDWNEMAKKTAFRRLTKWLPLSAEIRDALERDDDRLAAAVEHPRQTVSIADMTRRLTEQPIIDQPASEQVELDWESVDADFSAQSDEAGVRQVFDAYYTTTPESEREQLQAVMGHHLERVRPARRK